MNTKIDMNRVPSIPMPNARFCSDGSSVHADYTETENEHTPSDEEIEKALSELCCKKCFGRGYTGWTLSNDPILCDCVRKHEPLSKV